MSSRPATEIGPVRRRSKKALPSAVGDSHGRARGLRKLQSYMQISRWNAGPLGAVPAGLGAIAAGFDVVHAIAATLLMVAVLVFANIVNAVGDLEEDRTDPRRGSDALVSGDLAAHQAMLSSLLLLLLIGPAGVVLLDNAAAVAAFVTMLAVIAYINLYHKRSARVHPVVMDLLFGLYHAAPLVIFASLSTRPLQAALVLLACSLSLQITVYIVLLCATKDLECDIRYGVRGSAIELGVRPGRDGPLISRSFAVYVVSLQAGVLLSAVAAGVLATPSGALAVTSTVAGVALLTVGTVNLLRPIVRTRAEVNASSHVWTSANYIATLAIATGQLAPASVCLLFAGVVAVTGLSIMLSRRERGSSKDLVSNLLVKADNRY